MNDSVRQIVAYLAPARRVLLMGHVDPDGDVLGALLALGEALRRQGKQVVLAVPNAPASKYAFLPGVDALVTQVQGPFDLFISLDASDPQRLRHLYTLAQTAEGAPLLNIDHHVTNVRFGTLNWVSAQAAATSEMVAELVDALGLDLDRALAFPLLVGLVSDTRGFRTPTTTPQVLRLAGRLIEAGAPLSEVMERTMNTRPYAMMCLWGKMIAVSRLEERVAWTILTPEMRRECAVSEDGDGGFVNFLATAQEADVGVLFHDLGDGGIEIGFRSKPGIDIAQVAFQLGGGGHAQAAGCMIYGELEPVRQRVLAMVREALAGQTAQYR